MTIKRALVSIMVLSLFSFMGCDKEVKLSDALAKVQADALVDLDAADAIAVAAGDEIAHACYPVLKEWFVSTLGTSTPTVSQVKGVFSAFEKARTVRIGIEGTVGAGGPTIPVKVKLGCAALLQDERLFALRLAAMIGGASVGVPGISAVIPK